ncbi:MAG: NAD-dependent epimerase/dehydratase family protein, partial [Alphaproteobacteria bacterium]|nr:NAD-dependent epimerase/dehydratase family protein [Alphaproteobacteria bacterium]
IDGQDVIIHLAAETGTGQSMYEISKYVKVNVGGTAALWDVLVNNKNSIKKIVLASSRAIYGEGSYQCQVGCGLVTVKSRMKAELQEGRWEPICSKCGGLALPMPTSETAIPMPVSLYACTKLAQEQMSLTIGKAQRISVGVLRFQNVYGPGQSLQNPYTGILSIFSNQLRQNLPVNIYEDGAESRDFVFVQDVVQACRRTMELKDFNIVMNVGSGRPTTVLELAHVLKQRWRSKSPVTVTGAFRVGDIRHNWADLTQLYRLWPDWKITTLDAGLVPFIEWAKGQLVFEDKTRGAEQELKFRNL